MIRSMGRRGGRVGGMVSPVVLLREIPFRWVSTHTAEGSVYSCGHDRN